MILIFPPGIATSSVGAASNIGTSLIEKVPLQIQSCKSACYFVFINTHSPIALFVFLTKFKDALNHFASSVTTPPSFFMMIFTSRCCQQRLSKIFNNCCHLLQVLIKCQRLQMPAGGEQQTGEGAEHSVWSG